MKERQKSLGHNDPYERRTNDVHLRNGQKIVRTTFVRVIVTKPKDIEKKYIKKIKKGKRVRNKETMTDRQIIRTFIIRKETKGK